MIVQPFIGKLNDVYESKYVNGVLLLIAGLLGIVFMFLKNIYLIALVYSLVLSITNGTNPIIERMAVLSRFKYGSIRVWATIGYALQQSYQDIFIKTLDLLVFMFSLR